MAFSSRRKTRCKSFQSGYQAGKGRRFLSEALLFLELLEDRLVPSTFKWLGASGANWDTVANWTRTSGTTGTFPNAIGDIAQFTGTTGGTTVTLDIPVTVGEIDFGSSLSYTINSSAAANTLTLQATSGNALLKTLTSPANTGTDILAAQVLVSASTPLSATLAQGTLKLTNISATNPNTVTGTFTVTGGTLEGFSTQTANTDALGTANVVLNGGTLKVDPVPSVFSAAGVTGRYFNTGFTAANNGTSPAVGQVDYSGTPGATRSDANVNFTSLTTSNLPTGISTNAGSTNTQNNFAVEWAGGFNIVTGGSYTFTDQSDDGSQLFIDGIAVNTNNSNTTTTSAAVTLSAGVHSFEVRYYQGSGGANQVISYDGPDSGNTAMVIPGAASLSASGLFQYASGSTAMFGNNVTINSGITGTIDMTGAAMDATLGTLTTAGTGTLNVLGSVTGRTVNFGNVTLGGNVTMNPTGANVALGTVTDNNSNFSITKNGAGTLNLTAAASMYAGAVTLNAGTLALSNAMALGTGGLSVTAGTVVINAAGALGTTINLTSGETLVANTANVLSGATVNVGAGAIVQGIGANALAGAIINLNGGGLSVRADATATIGGTVNVNSNSSVIDVNRLGLNVTNQTLSIAGLTLGAGVTTLNITGAAGYTLLTTGAVALSANLIVNTVDANFSFGGGVSGAFTITKVGVSSLTFSVDSTGWIGSGGTTLIIQQGIANLSTANAGGVTGSTVMLQGGTLALNSTAAVSYAINVALDPSLGVGTINNPNNFTNTITGTLTLAPSQQLQTTGQNTIVFSTAALVTMTGYYVFNTNGASLQLNGLISGTGAIVKQGGNTLILGASGGATANTYTGGSIVNAGTLQANGVVGGTLNNFGTGTITLNGGQVNLFADSGQNNVYSNNIVANNNATIGFGRTGSSSVTNSIIYLTGTLTVGNNTLTFNQNNNYIFAISGATTLTGNVSIAGNGVVVFSGAVGDGGNGYGITKTATNTVIFNAVNTYTGATRSNAGNLAITSTGKIASSNVYVEPGAILTLPSATGWYSNATQPTLTLTSSTTALAEVQLNYNGALPTITGGAAPTGGSSGGVIALGLNLALTGGATTINIPVLGSNPAIVMTAFAGPVTQAINLGSIGDGTFYLGAASNITYTGTLTTSGTTLRLGAGGAQLGLGGSNMLADNGGPTTLVVGTSLPNGTGTLTNGTGTLVLINNNTYTGGTVVNRSSTLVISTTATASASPLGSGAVTVFGTLIAAGANGTFLANGSTATNTNAITLNPGSILSFDSVNAYGGTGGLAAGNNNNRWGDSVNIALNGSTLQLLGQNNAAGTAETVGMVSFDKGSVITVKRGNSSGTTKLTVAGLTRIGHGTLTLVTSATGNLGSSAAGGEQLVDSNAGMAGDAATTPVAVNTGAGDTNADTMTAPYIVNGTDNTFVSFGQSGKVGFGNTKFSSLSITAAGATGLVNVTAATALSASVSVYALAVTGAFALTNASGTNTVTSVSGGLIFTGSATHTVNFSYGASANAEALIYTASGATVQHTGTDATSGGLTKFGQGLYSLQGANTGLSGGLVNNANSNSGTSTIGAIAGTLELKTNTQAGGATGSPNVITLNGGTLNLRYDSSTTLPNSVVVAPMADAIISADRAVSTSVTGQTLGLAQVTVGNSTLSFSSGDAYNFTLTGAITLTGNATIATGSVNTSNAVTVAGGLTDGGSGYGVIKTGNNSLTINGSGTTSGVTDVFGGTLTLGASLAIGTAAMPTIVDAGATLNLAAATNLATGNVVAVNSNNVGVGALGIGFNGALPSITATSSGVLGINTTYNFANLNLATIGNGTFSLGSTLGGTYSGTALTIGAGNVWRLGGGGNTLTITNAIITDGGGPTPVQVGVPLANGTASVTNGGGTVNFNVTQTYTGTTTLAGVTVTYIDNTTSNSTTVFSQTLIGNIILMGNSTINAGGSAAFTSNYLLVKGQLNYGGNTLTFGNGVVALDPSAPAASGAGNTVLAGGVTLHLSAMNQLSPGNLQLNNGTFVLGKDDGTGVAPSWTQFMAFYSLGYGSGPNQWQITGSTGGFAAKGAPATILVNNGANSVYGYVTSQTLFDRDFRLGNDRRGNLTGVAGSQVFYADQAVILAQNTSLDAIRNISIAPTGPGISGAPGTGVVYRITGNLSGFGAPHFQTFDTEQAPTGGNYTEASEVVLAGLNSWTGNPGNVQGVNAGAGGLILDQNVFVRFLTSASLPTGNNGAPAFLAAIRDGQNNYGGGYLLTAGSTYTMPAGLNFLFGDGLAGSGNLRTSVLGITSDAGGGGTTTLQNLNILIVNATGLAGGGLVELSPSAGQTMSLLVRDGTLNLGSGANAVTFQYATDFFYSNTNLYIGDGVLNTLNLYTSSSTSSFGIADAQGGSSQRTLEKDGNGTAILNNLNYTFAVAGTTAATSFNWSVGNGTTPGGLLQLGAANLIPAAVSVFSGTLDLNSFNDTVTSLTMGSGAAGTSSTVNTETGMLTLGGNITYNVTNNPNAATINGNLNLGSSTRTVTVNHSTANTNDLIINAVISGTGGLTLAGAGQLLLTAANTYSGTTTITSGTLVVGANAPSGAAGALGSATSAVLLGNTSGSSSAALLVGGAFTVGRAVTVQAGNTGTMTLGGNSASAATFSGALTVSNTGGVTLTAATGGSVTFSGVISGANPIIAAGPGTVVLTNTGNTYTGVTTITGGILSISSDRNLGADPGSATPGNVVINGGTLQATASFTLNSNRGLALGPSSGSGMGTIDVTGTNVLTYNGILANNGTDSGGLVKTDSGFLILSGVNTYSAGTLITGGTLEISADANLGAVPGSATLNNVIIDDATLQATASFTLNANRGIALGTTTGTGTGAFDVTGTNTLTYGGILANNGAGTDSLTVTDTGTLLLTGVSTFTGGTTIIQGTLKLGIANALPTAATVTLGSSTTTGTLDLNGFNQAIAGLVNVGSSGNTVTDSSATVATLTVNVTGPQTYAGLLTGTLGLTKAGAGSLTISNTSNSYSGGTTINSGILSVAADAALGNATATLTISNGATFQTTQSVTSARPVILGPGGGIFDVANGTTQTRTGVISSVDSTGSLTLIDTGTLVLSASNTYSGGTIINAGVLSVPSAAALGALTATLTINNGTTYQTTQSFTTSRPVVLGPGGGIFDVAAGTTQTRTGVISSVDNTGSLTLTDTGTLVLSGSNTYSGGTIIRAGVLSVPSAAALGALTVALTIDSGATYQSTQSFSSARPIILGPGGGIFDVATGTIQTITGVISSMDSTGSLTLIDAGTLVLNASNTYSGDTVVNAGVLSVSSAAALGALTATLTINNGATYQTTQSFTSSRQIVLGPGGGVFDVAAGTTQTDTGIISSDDSTGSLTKVSGGTLALTAANTYSGATIINGGTLLANNSLGSATGFGAISVNVGATLGGTGSVAGMVTVNGGTVSPGGSSVGMLTVAGADLSNGGTLLIQVPAYGMAGTNYDQLFLTGALTLGGTSTLVLDLSGLTMTGTAGSFAQYGSVAGAFTRINFVNNPNAFTTSVDYNNVSADVNILSVTPISLHYKFNYPGNTPLPGYTSVLPTTTYTAGQGYGWQNTTGLFAVDRHGPTPLLQDFIQGSDNTFLVDVPSPGTYVVNLTMGDLINPHGPVDIIANGVDEFGSSLIQEIAGQYVTATFSVNVTGMQLQLEIKRIGGDPFWAVNAIDIRTAPTSNITLSASPPTITGDGMATSTISGTSSLPPGSLVTVTTSLGTITTADADPNYAGVQVVVGAGGAFSFTVRAPLIGGTATITAQEVTAAASGMTTLTITPPSTFHLKFNKPGNTAPNGYISVLPTTLFASTGSYGWQSTSGLFAIDRGGPTPLLRDFIQGSDNTFQVALSNGSYLVNLTMGDLINPHGPVDIIANGVDVFAGNPILEPSGQYVTPNFVVNVTSGNMLNLEIKRLGGDPFWAVNAIDIVPASSAVWVITLMSSVPTLNADGMSTATISGTGAKPNSLITVSASLGTILTADADPNYAGIQVRADGSGNFSFVIQAPSSSGGTVLITANDVTGAATGSSSSILSIVPPSTFHFDFAYLYNTITQSGYQRVLPTNVYSATIGYGWTTPLASYYRTSTPFLGTPALEQLQRSAHLDQNNTFKILVHVTGVNHFNVTVYLGDNDHPHKAHVVIGGSAGTVDEGVVATGVDNPMSPMGGFAIITYSIPAADFTPDANGNDVLTIHLTGMATMTDPGDNFFNANGVDVVASTMATGAPGGGTGPSALAVSTGTAAVSPVNAGPAFVTPSSSATTNPVPSIPGVSSVEFDAALAQVMVADQPLAPASRWSFLGQALKAQNRVETGMPAPGLGGSQVRSGRQGTELQALAVAATRPAGATALANPIHPSVLAPAWNRDPLQLLDQVFEDMMTAD
jgi:autotransporter-associated beta strand protein